MKPCHATFLMENCRESSSQDLRTDWSTRVFSPLSRGLCRHFVMMVFASRSESGRPMIPSPSMVSPGFGASNLVDESAKVLSSSHSQSMNVSDITERV